MTQAGSPWGKNSLVSTKLQVVEDLELRRLHLSVFCDPPPWVCLLELQTGVTQWVDAEKGFP